MSLLLYFFISHSLNNIFTIIQKSIGAKINKYNANETWFVNRRLVEYEEGC